MKRSMRQLMVTTLISISVVAPGCMTAKLSGLERASDPIKEEVFHGKGWCRGRIFSAGGDALKDGRIKPAKEAIAYAEKLSDFVKKIQKLGDEWLKLEARIDAAAPEVKEIVQLPKSQKAHKTGFTRKVTTVAPKSNFTVRFPDGVTIADKKAYWVLAKSIEKLGVADVAKLGVMVGGEPLVTQDKALLKKHPNAIAAIKGGWFVKTHSGTAAKMRYVKTIAKALKVKVVIAGV